jgi:EAL domain-containing protein (putative c-di-GMP-specific phosphodiesterase class I)
LKCLGLLGTDVLFGAKAQDVLYASCKKRVEKTLRAVLKEAVRSLAARRDTSQCFELQVTIQAEVLQISVVARKDVLDDRRTQELVNRLLTSLKKPLRLTGETLMLEPDPRIGYHLGSEAAFDKAAFALARASLNNPVQSFDARQRQLRLARMRREAEIRDGLRRGEFVSYFQPKIDPRNNKVVGGEALVRWQHPKKGLLMPKEFIGIAEESSLICEISRAVAKQTITLLTQLKQKAKAVPIAINLSEQDLKGLDLIEQLGRQLKRQNLKPELINLEVSERVASMNEEDLSEFMKAVRKAGFSLALDDFGTAYSGLLRLLQLPISEIKVDRLFLVKAAASAQGRSILQNLVCMLLEQKFRVTVEGVEKPRELKILKAMPGCFAQGFYFSPAVDARTFQGLNA